jgi:hypothetical protein
MDESTIKLDGKLIELLEKVKEARKDFLDDTKPMSDTLLLYRKACSALADYLIENETKDKGAKE